MSNLRYLQFAMIDPNHIDVDHSLATGWLKGKFPLIDLIQWLLVLFIPLAFFFTGVYFTIETMRVELYGLASIIAAGSVVSAYGVYRALTVNKLHKVETMMLAKDIRPLIIEFFMQRKYEVQFDSDDILVLQESESFARVTNQNAENIIVLYKNCTLHFCVTGAGVGARTPAFFPPVLLKKELRSLLN